METRTHRLLPHRHRDGAMQFITWRCADSLPHELLRQIQLETDMLPDDQRKQQRASRIETYLDQGLGSCSLRANAVGGLVRDHILSLAGEFFKLHDYVIMPNHVHVLLTPNDGVKLATMMKHLKGTSAFLANEQLKTRGQFWQPEYFDRMIRDSYHADRVGQYIRYNPVKAGLCDRPEDWSLSSALIGPNFVRESQTPYGNEYDPFLDQPGG
jgi:REP element-mobilizing transposase RayT